jgi:hypothetical protein
MLLSGLTLPLIHSEWNTLFRSTSRDDTAKTMTEYAMQR